MIELYGGPRTRAFRCLWLLEEMGVDYAHNETPPQSDALRAVYPNGKVPVLLEAGQIISDSTAILTYLSDKHNKFTFPAGTLDRARQDSLTQFLLDELDACLWTAARHSFILPQDIRVPAIKDSLKWEFARAQKELVRRLGDGPFLMGEQMTIADIIATHCGTWAAAAKFDISEPAFADYIARMKAREGWQAVARKAAKPKP